MARRGFTVFHFYRIQREDGCTQVYLGYYVHLPKAIIIYHLPGVTRLEEREIQISSEGPRPLLDLSFI